MKAINVIEWMVGASIEAEYLQIWDLDEDTDYTATFGYEPAVKPSAGKYMVMWSDTIDDTSWPYVERRMQDEDGAWRNRRENVQPDCVLLTDNADKKNGGVAMIMLFKLED